MMKSSLVILIVMIGILTGCERATRQIEREQARIELLTRQTTHELEQSIEHVRAATETDEVGAAAQGHLDQSVAHQRTAMKHQERIAAAADRTRARLPDVEDKMHPLVRLAQTWGTVALVLAIIALLAYLGIGPLIRRGFQALGLLIPGLCAAMRSSMRSTWRAEPRARWTASASPHAARPIRRTTARLPVPNTNAEKDSSTDANLRAQTKHLSDSGARSRTPYDA